MRREDIDPDARRFRASIRALVRRFSISERADVSCCGMTVAQAATLEALRVEGPMRAGDMGRRLGVSPSTLTRNLARLEERGWVRREADPADGRAQRVVLTREGRRAARWVSEIAGKPSVHRPGCADWGYCCWGIGLNQSSTGL